MRAYGFGHYGKALIWNSAGLLFAYYLTEIAGLPASTAGLLMGGSMLLSALADLALGTMLSRVVVDCAKAAKFQRLGATSASLALVVFTLGAFIPAPVRMSWLVATLIGFRISYSLFDIAQNAYLSLASTNPAVRAALTSVRFTASGVATLTVGLAFAAIAPMRGGQEGRTLFLALAIFTAAVTVLGAHWAPSSPIPDAVVRPMAQVRKDGASGRRRYLRLLIAISAVTLASEFFFKFEAHFAALAVPQSISPWLLVASATGQIASQPVWRRLATRGGEARLLLTASLAWGTCSALALFAPIHGPVLLLGGFLYSACLSGVAAGLWMVLARAAAPPANTTRCFGVFTFVAKATEGVTMPFLGLLLQRAFYSEHPWSTRELWLLMLLPAFFAAFVILALLVEPFRRSFWPVRDQADPPDRRGKTRSKVGTSEHRTRDDDR